MTLIKSISGIRGTIGGKVGEGLSPLDAVKFAASYGTWLKNNTGKKSPLVIIGRDARPSGQMIENLVVSTLQGLGVNIINAGLSTTPTIEMAVIFEKADGGIILTASHNPKNWNALKLLNDKGEFLSKENGEKILQTAEAEDFDFAEVDGLGSLTVKENGFIDEHIDSILALPLVQPEEIKKKNFKVVVDAVNSTGGIAIPKLLEKLGVETIELYCEPNGEFPHNPEPLKSNLIELSKKVIEEKADMGFAVDPDVDRLAIMQEDGEMFGEEYTLVAVADYILKHNPGSTVSNLSSSRALKDLTQKYKQSYSASPVGEVNVVLEMKKTGAVIGGEGNGGVIYPELHYGRDSLVGIALFLSHLATSDIPTVSELRKTYSHYEMTKDKISLTPEIDVDKTLEKVAEHFSNESVDTRDGVKIDFPNGWVHLRKSNTEPIIRVYSESSTEKEAQNLVNSVKKLVI